MPGDYVTLIYQPESFPPGFADTAGQRFLPAVAAAAGRAGFTFRTVAAHSLVPACTGQPRLWRDGDDLLQVRQCFQVDDFSSDPQTASHLDAIRAAINAGDSTLLNNSADSRPGVPADKFSMMLHAARLGVSVPVTIAVPPGRHARSAVAVADREIGPGPYILKPRNLAMGFAVLRAAAVSELTAAVDITAQTGIGYIIQPCIEHASDTRAYFADGEVIAAQERTAAPGSYLANLSQGGAAAACRDTSAIAGLTCAIAESLHASLMSVDWMITPAGPVLSEWSTGIGAFAELPEPDMTIVGDAHFRWARQRFSQDR